MCEWLEHLWRANGDVLKNILTRNVLLVDEEQDGKTL